MANGSKQVLARRSADLATDTWVSTQVANCGLPGMSSLRTFLMAKRYDVHLDSGRPGFDSRLDLFAGRVIPVASKQVPQRLPCHAPGITGSAQGLAGWSGVSILRLDEIL